MSPDASRSRAHDANDMSTHQSFTPPASDTSEPMSPVERLEEDAALAGVVAAHTARAVEVAGVGLIGLFVCPPLAILVFLGVAPFLVVALAIGLFAAVLSTPYLLFHHFRAPERGHMSLLTQRYGRVTHAVIDLAPHRIVADARRLYPHR